MWVLIWEYSARAIQWISTWQCLEISQKDLLSGALDESSLRFGRVKGLLVRNTFNVTSQQGVRFLGGKSLEACIVFQTELLSKIMDRWLSNYTDEEQRYIRRDGYHNVSLFMTKMSKSAPFNFQIEWTVEFKVKIGESVISFPLNYP